jgi:FecR protein
MSNVYRRSIPFLMATVFGTGVIGISGIAYGQAQTDPPARVGRLAFAEGTVSFHDAQDANWTAAAVNDALTTGDSLWTEPNARSEISVSGARVRLDQSTQLDMLQVDDSTTRLQLDQGRLDVKTFTMDTAQPYEIVTPRGTVKLEAQGDYYVESGSTQDPTRLGVRSGAAQITSLNGQVLAVRAGEVGEISGDAQSPQLHTIQTAPPPVPQYWAQRDQQVSYAAPQYISADVVGYEDMQAYGAWSNDPDYGQVWSPNSVPANWQPYSTGSWAYSQPYGWTWVDEQPWGFAPYHYGRWANRNNRWLWVPPERGQRAMYAPALVAFLGGAELSLALGNNSAQPVGWFPLGPREAYVPPYAHDRAYYDRINTNAHVERATMDDRWNRAERHEAITANDPNEHMANRRFTTVVPASAFVSSQHVERAAIKVSADKLASAPIAAVSAPPAPAQGNTPKADTRFNGVQQIGRPTQAQRQEQRPQTTGPKIAEHTAPPAPGAKVAPPPLEPRRGAAPPVIQGERTQTPQPNAAQPNKPGEPNRPAEANRAEPPKPGQPATPQAVRPGEPNRPGEANRVEPPKPGQPPAAPQPQQTNRPEPPKPGQSAAPQAQQPAHQPEPQRPAEAPHATPPQPAHQAEAPHAAPPQPQHVEPQHVQAPPPVQHAAPPPPQPQQAQVPAPHPQAAPAPAPHPAPAKEEEKK